MGTIIWLPPVSESPELSQHVHLAINIEPHVTISEFIGELKGYPSHEVNKQKRMKRLEWQRGFGVVSFAKKHLRWVQDYIARQKEHHATGQLEERLERASLDDDGRRSAYRRTKSRLKPAGNRNRQYPPTS